MDVSVQFVDPVRKDLISPNDWGQLWSNCKQGDSNTVGSLVAELGIALEDALVLLSNSAPPLERCQVRCLENVKESEEDIIGHDGSLIVQKDLGCDAPLSGEDRIPSTTLDGQSSLKPSNSTSTRIVALPVVSAMKGSREKQGRHVEKLSVSWAPDVYDPPVTSQSHTVKSYNQYSSKMSKKSNRQHKQKGKSSRSNCIDKKKRRKSSSKVAS